MLPWPSMNWPAADVVVKLTVTLLTAAAALPKASSSAMVIVGEGTTGRQHLLGGCKLQVAAHRSDHGLLL